MIPLPPSPSCLLFSVASLQLCRAAHVFQSQLGVAPTRSSGYFYGERMLDFPVARITCFNFSNWLLHTKLQHTDPSCGHDSSFRTQESIILPSGCGLRFLYSGEKRFTYTKTRQKPGLAGLSVLFKRGFVRSTGQYLSLALLWFLNSASLTLIPSFPIPWGFACPVLAMLCPRESGYPWANGRAWDTCHSPFYRPVLLHCFVFDLVLNARDLFLPGCIGSAYVLWISSWSN